MNRRGYKINWQHNRKCITFTTPDGKKCRNSKLSNPEYFSKENMQGILDRNYAKDVELYFTPHQENFIELLADIFGQDIPIPTFINAPCFEGLSSVEIEILMSKYICSMEGK